MIFHYLEKLYQRILQLNQQIDLLQSKVKWTEDKLIKMAEEKDVTWLDSMLAYCKWVDNLFHLFVFNEFSNKRYGSLLAKIAPDLL